MRVLVTGASGHIGSAVVPELLGAGHQVVGLARSDSAAAALEAAGVEVCRGDLEDLDGLRAAAAAADGVIHLALKHSTDFIDALAADLAAIDALGTGLADSGEDKPFVGTTGSLTLSFIGQITERLATEQDTLPGGPRADAENAVIALADRGVRSSVVRLPPVVHSTLDRHGFVPTLIAIARSAGVSGYVKEGSNRWPAVHTLDAARLYRLALESAAPGSRLHAVADSGIRFREIAETIAARLDVATVSIAPDQTADHFAHLAPFVALDNPTSSELTREWLAWAPAHPKLIDDLVDGHYFAR